MGQPARLPGSFTRARAFLRFPRRGALTLSDGDGLEAVQLPQQAAPLRRVQAVDEVAGPLRRIERLYRLLLGVRAQQPRGAQTGGRGWEPQSVFGPGRAAEGAQAPAEEEQEAAAPAEARRPRGGTGRAQAQRQPAAQPRRRRHVASRPARLPALGRRRAAAATPGRGEGGAHESVPSLAPAAPCPAVPAAQSPRTAPASRRISPQIATAAATNSGEQLPPRL